jgi:hypothetical protein
MTGSNSSSSRGRRLPMIFNLLTIVVAIAAVAIGLGLAASGMAVAKKQPPKPAPTTGATIKATSFEVAAAVPSKSQTGTGEESAKCPGKQRALGGGVVQIGPATTGWVRASGPLDNTGDPANTQSGDIAKQWYASVANLDEQSQNFKVFAICSARSDATIEAKSFPVPDKKIDGAWAVCPANKRALGGGVLPIGPSNLSNFFILGSSPLDSTGDAAQTQSGDIAKQWIAFVENASGGPRELKVFAICSARSDATIEAASFPVAASGGGFGTNHAAWAVCPANKLRALGGGVFSNVPGHTPSGGILVRASGPLDSTGKPLLTESDDMARQWYTAVTNQSKEARNLKVFAICE